MHGPQPDCQPPWIRSIWQSLLPSREENPAMHSGKNKKVQLSTYQGRSCSLTRGGREPPIFFFFLNYNMYIYFLNSFNIFGQDNYSWSPLSPNIYKLALRTQPKKKKSPSLYWKILNWWKILYISFVFNIYLQWATNFSR